jgi:Fic family protein
LDTLYGKSTPVFSLPPEFFEVGISSNDLHSARKEEFLPSNFNKGHYKGHSPSFDLTQKTSQGQNQINRKDKEQSVNTNNRKEMILNIIKQNKEVTIRDITSVITDCSEKTIQRDLSALVASGVLKREGERRWSKYALVRKA